MGPFLAKRGLLAPFVVLGVAFVGLLVFVAVGMASGAPFASPPPLPSPTAVPVLPLPPPATPTPTLGPLVLIPVDSIVEGPNGEPVVEPMLGSYLAALPLPTPTPTPTPSPTPPPRPGTRMNPSIMGAPTRTDLLGGPDDAPIRVEVTVTALEAARGRLAEDLIGPLNIILNPPPEGEEYVVALVQVTYIDDQQIDYLESLRIQGDSFRLDVDNEPDDELLEPVLKLNHPEPGLPFVLYPGQTFDAWVVFTISQDAPTPSLGFLGAEYHELDWLTALPFWWELDPEKVIRPQGSDVLEVPFLP